MVIRRSKKKKEKIGSKVTGWYTDKKGRRRPITKKQNRPEYSRKKVVVTRIKPPTQEDRYSLDLPNAFLNGLFQGALVHGISAVFPPAALFLLPAYDLFNYGKFGVNLLKLHNELSKKSNRNEIRRALRKTAEPYGDIASQPVSDLIAGALVTAAQDTGLIMNIAKITSTEEDIYSKILEGSISNGLSNGVGNLTAYSVGLF